MKEIIPIELFATFCAHMDAFIKEQEIIIEKELKVLKENENRNNNSNCKDSPTD